MSDPVTWGQVFYIWVGGVVFVLALIGFYGLGRNQGWWE